MERKPDTKLAWLAGAGTLLAVLACYGTLAVVGGLSLLGISLVIHEGAWAAAISLFAIIALAGIGLGYRRHRVVGPLASGAIGTALVLWAMVVSYDRIVEVVGFIALVTGAAWDWRVKRRP
ncbi:MAG: MerC domain-containing protein [Rhodospirillales bacterium]|nr:MerC domain-containing protein [Rhodospirillales bacterium]